MEPYWVPHPDLVFAPCWYHGQDDTNANFTDDSGQAVTLPVAEFGALEKVTEQQLMGTEDICKLDVVNKAALLHTVRIRFVHQQVYTKVSKILIAVNPFEQLLIYSSQYIEKYRQAGDSADLPPHVYGVGLDAVQGLHEATCRNQAVLISGESGAGKTESTKLVLMYVADTLGGGQSNIQDKILQTNPVLEAFGNAMTVRNNNSSRFGKWLQIILTPTKEIRCCSVMDYLLELTRVCNQGEKERNYHVFFQLIAARHKGMLKSYHIEEPSCYRYLRDAQVKAPGIDDGRDFDELEQAFATLGFSPDVQQEIFALVVGVLTLGNTDFKGGGDAASDVANEEVFLHAAQLLQVNGDALRKALLVRKIVIGKDATEAPRTPEQAANSRDGLARLIYGRLFKWLIHKINVMLGAGADVQGQFFGVLDIAGFESFEHNSLEQLFINLSNEHLQHYFNNHIFKQELDDYRSEGLLVGDLTYEDNSDIVTLIDSKGGILALLDEEVAMPKATDETFLKKVQKEHGSHRRLIVPKIASNFFGVRHFAGDVKYEVSGFLVKNIDKPPDDAPAVFMSSGCSVLREIGEKIGEELAEATAGGGRGAKKAKTVSIGFRSSLQQLVAQLGKAQPHFIRCIKPNAEKVRGKFTSSLAMDQLMNSGVFEAVKIRQAGFGSRIDYDEFMGRYRVLLSKATWEQIQKKDGRERATAFNEALPDALGAVGGVQPGELELGTTKFFLKTRLMSSLEKNRDLAVSGSAVQIQRRWRGHQARKMLASCQAVFGELDAWHAENRFYTAPGSEHTAVAKLGTADAIRQEIERFDTRSEKVRKLPISYPHLKKLERVRQRMENEVTVISQLQAAHGSADPVEINKALARAKDVELPENQQHVQALLARKEALNRQLPLVSAMQAALEQEDLQRLQDVLNAVKKEGLHLQTEDWIDGLQGAQLAAKVYDRMEDLKAKRKVEAIKNEEHEKLMKAMEETHPDIKEVAVLEPFEKKRKHRATITGLSEEGQQELLLALSEACRLCDSVAIDKHLYEATRHGIEPCAEIELGQAMVERLQKEAYLIETIKENQKNVRAQRAEGDSLQCLQNLVAQAKRLGVAQDAVEESKPYMQEGMKRRIRATIKGQIFEDMDTAAFDLVDATFGDLTNFTQLRPWRQWKGHKVTGVRNNIRKIADSVASLLKKEPTDGEIQEGQAAMLQHSNFDILDSLTQMPSGHLNSASTQNFRNVLKLMGDRFLPDSQRFSYSSEIVQIALADRRLCNEVYVQLMKQLTRNPSRLSRFHGWSLMLLLCQKVAPTPELHEFILAFLIQNLHDGKDASFMTLGEGAEEDFRNTVKQCIADLNISVDPGKAAGEAERLIPVHVLLIDHSTRKVHVPSASTLSELRAVVSEQLRISNAKDFSFFQSTDGLGHRLLPDNAVLATLSQKWARLKDITGKSSHLLYKRRFMRIDETLQPGDSMHAHLTYMQAVSGYLQYPVQEDAGFLSQIAAAILAVDPEDYGAEPPQGRVAYDPDVLDALIPASCLGIKTKKKWWEDVMGAYSALRTDEVDTTARLVKRSRVFSMVQRMKLFGAYFWLGREVSAVLPDKASVRGAPSRLCQINPREKNGDYWICVDLFGIRFVSADSKPGSVFQRGFLYNEEAVEHLLAWGGKDDIVQLVVSSLPHNEASAGTMPMTIMLRTPASIDIAYTITMIRDSQIKSG